MRYCFYQQFRHEGEDVFSPVVEPEFDLLEVEVEVRAWDTPVMIEPDLGVREKALDAVDVVSCTGILFFAMGDLVVLAPEGEHAVAPVLIGVVNAPPLCMLKDEGKEGSPPPVGDGEGDDSAVSLVHPEDHLLAFGSPTALTLPPPTEEGLIELQFPAEGLHLFKRSIVDGLSDHPENSLGGAKTAAHIEPGPIRRNTKTEKVEEMRKLIEREPDPLKISAGEIAEGIAATGASEPLPLTPQSPLCAPGAEPSTTPSELDKKSPTFWQARSQCNCLSDKHKNMISQSQFFTHYL